jgi:AraC-like DNA-binding protein
MTGHGEDWLDFARDAQSGTEAVRAQLHSHAYDPHFHDQVLVGVTEAGVQQFRCRRQLHRSTPGRVILMEPGDVHDGEAGAPSGFVYAMLYFDPAWLRQNAALYAGRAESDGVWHFPQTLADDPALAAAIAAAYRQIAQPDSRMARESALDQVVALLSQRFLGAATQRETAPRLAQRAKDAIDALCEQDIGLQDLVALAGAADRFRLHRAFKAAYGLPPHAYLVQRRLSRARQWLAKGMTPAEVAAGLGFADQSHLGRWFKRAYGMTPAAYRAACTNLPDARLA